MDYVVVLEGVQGLGKSQFIRALAGCDEWFTDRLPDDEREAAIKMQGKWFVELGELASITRKDVDKLKAFITSQNDECRLPYGRMTVNLPRQCLFVGTTNSSSYLRDETGERRFFPVSCVKLNLADLRRDRDQIFAEAFARYKDGGEELYIKDPIIQAIATRQQRMRTVADPWVQLIAPFLDGKNPDKLYYEKITPLEIWEKCFTRLGSNITAIDNSRIMRSLAVIGWDKHLAESDGVSTLVYERPQEFSFL
jgi:predicted P-loop ATPase